MKDKVVLYGLSFGVQFIVTIAVTLLTVHYYPHKSAVTLFYNLNIVTFLTTFISLGIPQALIRYQYIETINKRDLNQTVALTSLVSTILAVVITSIIGGYETIFLVLLLPFTVAQYYLRSIEDFKKFIGLYLGRLVLIIIGSLVIFFSKSHDVLLWYVVVGLSYIIGVWFHPSIKGFKINLKLLKSILEYSIPLQLYSFLLQGVFLIGQIVLEKYGAKSSFEEYVITWRLIQILQAISALVFFFYPQFYFKNIEKNRAFVIKAQNLIIFGLIVISIIILIAKPLLDLIFKYHFNYKVLIVLLISEIVRLSAGIINTKFSFYMKNRVLLYTLSISVICMFFSWLILFLYHHVLTSLDISLGLLSCFGIYFISTYVMSLRFGNVNPALIKN